jgi:acetyltransferase-like isoleucine patch superfamily enzyme
MRFFRTKLGRFLLLLPIIRYKQFVYKILGVKCVGPHCKFFIGKPTVIGDYHNIWMHENAEIERGCTLIAKDKIVIGENSTLAYGVMVLTSADPNGPYNRLSKLYPPIHAPVIIGNNCWIGARSLILPGVTIGDCCVVAAGSVVIKDVPSNSLVAGVPAEIKKTLDV